MSHSSRLVRDKRDKRAYIIGIQRKGVKERARPVYDAAKRIQ